MALRILELTLVSASNLKDVNFFSDMEVYAVASVYGDPRTRQRTRTDRDGETEPTWDDTLWFAVPPTAAAAAAGGACLHVLLLTERLFGDDRDVGEVFIPLAVLLAGACAGATAPRCASYQVRKVQCSKRRGMLSISYRLGPVMTPAPPQLPPDTGCWDYGYQYQLPPWECYPIYAPLSHPSGVGMRAAANLSGRSVAATSAGTWNVKKNSSFALGLAGGGFERMLFGDMPSYDTAARKSG